ncbi:MAG: HD domain-containing protein [Coriobacteriia bacterium]
MSGSIVEAMGRVRVQLEQGGALTALQGEASFDRTGPASDIADELCRCAESPAAADIFGALVRTGVLPLVLPEIASLAGVSQSPPHVYDVLEHTLAVVRSATRLVSGLSGRAAAELERDSRVTWALGRLAPHREWLAKRLVDGLSPGRTRGSLLVIGALLHDIAKPLTRSVGDDGRVHFYRHEDAGVPIVRERLAAVEFVPDEIDFVAELVLQHLRPLEFARESALPARVVKRFVRDTPASTPEVCLLSLADQLGKGDEGDDRKWRRLIERVVEVLDAYSAGPALPPPAVLLSGTDLMVELGLQPGRLVGRLLAAVREAQERGEVADRDAAIKVARRTLEECATTGVEKEGKRR